MSVAVATPAPSAAEIARQFPPSLAAMLATGQARGRTRQLPYVGGSTHNNLYILHRLFAATAARRTLEIGLACGTSALLLAALHRDRDGAGRSQHVAVDPFQHELDDAGVQQLEADGLADYVTLHRETSFAALPKLLAADLRFDLIYVDGSHLFEDVFIDFFYGIRLLQPEGVIAFDDSTHPDVRKLLRFVRRNYADRMQPLDLMALRPPETVTLKTRVAGRLGRMQMTAFRLRGDPIRPWSAPLVDF